MAGIDSYVQLLLHCDGVDQSTSFPDSSDYSRSISAVATAQVDTDITDAFGNNEGVLQCDGNSDYLSVTDFAELDLGSTDFTFDFWVRFNSISGHQGFFGRDDGSSYFYCAWESGSHIRFRDYPSDTINTAWSWSPSINTWYHIAIVRYSDNVRCYVDGTQLGATIPCSGTFTARTSPLFIGSSFSAGYFLNGWIDEFRFSPGIARWTSNFTPPTEPYAGDEILNIEETVTLNDNWQIYTNPEQQTIEETVTLNDEWIIQSNPEQEQIFDTITINDNWSTTLFQKANYATKIISADSLIFVTDTNPSKILHVDITDPTNPIITGAILVNVQNANSVSYNTETEFLYVTCIDGKVVKIDINNLDSQTIIDLNDTNDLLTGNTFSIESLTYINTDDTNGELYLIDERETAIIDTDFKYLSPNEVLINNQFNFIEAFFLDTNFQYLQTNNSLINTDFKWLANNFDEVIPLARTDFHVYVDDVELANDDLILESINITHTISEKSSATFTVARNHDNINSPLNGGTVTLTNQNNVKIYIGTNLEFDGKISNLSCVFEREQENVVITALMAQPTDNRKQVTLSLPSLNEQLSLYNVLMENPNIYNPYIDQNEENPEIYKGVKVDLGTKITQFISRYQFIETTIAGKGQIASSIENGTFKSEQNWQYFWLATARNIITNVAWYLSRYIGTSLSSLNSDMWEIIGTPYFMQRQRVNTETDLGYYTIGSAPYLDVSIKNGQLIAVNKWADKDDGLYLDKDEGYNYVGKLKLVGEEYQTLEKGYAQKVADLEYSKLLNINGDVLPLTNVNMSLLIDGYYYYALKLLTRINIDNTTASNIFKNNNGFPVSIKTINISSEEMVVRLDTNNSKSYVELQEIDDSYPDENSDEYLFPEESKLISRKFDPNLNRYVE